MWPHVFHASPALRSCNKHQATALCIRCAHKHVDCGHKIYMDVSMSSLSRSHMDQNAATGCDTLAPLPDRSISLLWG